MNQLHSRSGAGSSYGTSDGLVGRALIGREHRVRKFSSREAIATSKVDDDALQAFSTQALQHTEQAKVILSNPSKDALSDAVALLEADSLEWWADGR